MQKISDVHIAEAEVREQNAINDIHFEKRETNLKAYIFGAAGKDPGAGFHKWYTEEAGMDTKRYGDSRREGINLLERMAASGELKRGEFAKIKNFEIQLGGQGKFQRLGTLYADEFATVEKAFNDREKRENQVFDVYRKTSVMLCV